MVFHTEKNGKGLAKQFEKELIEKTLCAKKECGYNPTRFHQMMAECGAVETAKRLIDKAQKTGNPSDGYTTLWLCGRLDLTMEDSVRKPEYQSLFTDGEISYCEKLLQETTDKS